MTARTEEFGRDGQKILTAAWAASVPPGLRLLPQTEILRQVPAHHYFWDVDGRLRRRHGHALPPPRCGSTPRMTLMRTASSGTPPGADTGDISRKRATKNAPSWWSMSPPPSPPSRTSS
ncbi:hypothetical protein ACQ4WX_00325 [Streptomyces lasalocidi]